MLDDLRRDLRYAVRQFASAPAFTLVATLTLSLGVGANAAIFSVINGLLLRPLPFPQPEQLLFIEGVLAQPDREIGFQLGYPDIQDLRTEVKSFAGVAPWATSFGVTLDREDAAQRLAANFVGLDYFTILGGTPLLGRTFTPEDHAIGAEGTIVAIVSEATWRQEFGADPAIVGREIRMQDRVFTVVGVMPGSFSDIPESTGERIDVWAPLERAPGLFGAPNLADRGNRLMWAVARLTEGATLASAQAELTALSAHIAAANPATNANFTFRAFPLSSQYFAEARRPLWFLLGGSLFVLLIGCVNVANLLLVRAAARAREFAVRLAVGASVSRLLRQLWIESLLLAAAGAVGGLLLAAWITPVLLRLSNITLPAFSNAGIDPAVAAMTALTALVCGSLFGFAPMWSASRTSARAVLAGGAGRVARSSRTARWLAGVEITAAFVLAAGALVMLQSLSALSRTDLQFQSDHLLTARIELPQERYPTPAARARVGESLRERLAALPGVEHATIWGPSMFARSTWVAFLSPADKVVRDDETLMAWRHSTNPGALRDLEIPLLAGRDFTPADTLAAPLVAIVSQATAARLWPGQDPIGKQLRTLRTPNAPLTTVVGLAADARHRGRFRFSSGAAAYEPQLDIYLPFAQRPNALVVFGVRTTAPPDTQINAVRSAIAGVDRTIATFDIESLERRMQLEATPLAFATLLINLYGALAILLAGLGVYGVLAAGVASQSREIGIRSALGAEPRRLVRNVMWQGLSIAMVSIAIGGVVAWALLRTFSGALFGVTGGQFELLGATAVILVGMAVAASAIPARRASRIDPISVLRGD
jgi:putative ABC transport system permease protein